MIFYPKIFYVLEQPYLSGNDLLKCVYDVSQNNTYQLFMGEAYYKILEKNILSQSYYWHSLSGHWNSKQFYFILLFNYYKFVNFFRIVFFGIHIIHGSFFKYEACFY